MLCTDCIFFFSRRSKDLVSILLCSPDILTSQTMECCLPLHCVGLLLCSWWNLGLWVGHETYTKWRSCCSKLFKKKKRCFSCRKKGVGAPWQQVKVKLPFAFVLKNTETTGSYCCFILQNRSGVLKMCLQARSQNYVKATICFVMSVYLPFRTQQLGSHWTDFLEIWYSGFFEYLSRKFKFD